MPEDTMMSCNRRVFLTTSGLAGIGLMAGCISNDSSSSQSNFPSQDIEVIIPFGPGGGYDAYARLTAPYLKEYLPNDVDVTVRNVEGAGGQIATEEVYGSSDGYTNMIVNHVNFSLTQLTDDVNYDLREMTYFAQIASEFRGIAVGANTDIKTWDEFVSAVQNGEVRFASTGPGSGYVVVPGVIGHVSGLYAADNVMNNEVVYDGRGAALQGILGGDAEVMSGSFFSLLEYVQSGDLRMLMACTVEDQPPEETPEAETFSTTNIEKGEQIQNMLTTRRHFAGSPEVPNDQASVLQESYSEAIQDEELQKEAEEMDRPIDYADHEEVTQSVNDFLDSWSQQEELLKTLYGDDA